MPGEDLYRTVRLIRRFEERALELVRAGEIGSGIHPCIGQEGVAVGVCAALGPGDRILSSHRGHGHLLAKGTVDGGNRSCGLAAEILATAAEELPLVAPPARVTRPDGAILGAVPELDLMLQPSREQIAVAVQKVLKSGG